MDHKERYSAVVEVFNNEMNTIEKKNAYVICTMDEDKSAFWNALGYANDLGLAWGDPKNPKQTLGRTLADHIVKTAGL